MKLYCLYDLFAEKASFFFEQENDDCAKRYLAPMTVKSAHDLSTFRLDCLGSLDVDTPAVVAEHRTVCNLSEITVLEIPNE